MEPKDLKPFYMDYTQMLIDEIALEGLEGIGLDLLWRRMAKRMSSEVTKKMKNRYWNSILQFDCIQFYLLPEPIVRLEIVDRFTLIDEETGQLKSPDDYLDGPYEYCPVDNEYGSCKYYNTRKLMPKEDFVHLSYEKVELEYIDNLVLVASIEERWRALAGHTPIIYLSQLSRIHYCILELVGRSRENGQMTFGVTNITKVVKEPKTLFYNRKHLRDLDLIRVQYITQILNDRGVKSLLLRLKRFHQPKILSMPKVGKLHTIVQHLLQKPDYSEKTDILINKGMLTSSHSRKLRKTVNIFSFNERVVPSEKQKAKPIKKSFISLSADSDESSPSEDENEPPRKCQYKVGVGLLRQAYEQFLVAGRTGLTQVELSQLLGVEFYTSRTICRIFRSKHIVREFLEDKGRQRKARFIAIANTGKMEITYAKEKQKFLEYLNDCSNLSNVKTEILTTPEEIPIEYSPVPSVERMEVDNDPESEDKKIIKSGNIEQYVTEVKVLNGYEHIKVKTLEYTDRNLSLRQLRFANGLLKIVKEKLCVCGYQSLSNLVAAETGEPPMYAKCLKSFLQKLVNSGHLKMYKVKWPGFQERYSFFICAPNITVSDPVIKAKCREINIRAASKMKANMKKEIKEGPGRSLSRITLPRYMRIQKLHEFLISLVYFNPVRKSPQFSEGFISMDDFIPEMTVEFALGNITNMSTLSFHDYNMDELLCVRLRDAPADLYRDISECPSLHNTIRINLKVLAMLGLIQLIYQSAIQTPDHKNCGTTSFVFYVNRRAKIIDTTGIWPRPNADTANLEKSFYFESFEDVKTYWKNVYNISLNTKINVAKRERKKYTPPLRLPHEVHNYDTGERFCDGLGTCGFDSCFFMEIPRLWHATYINVAKKPQATLKKPTKAVKLTQIKKKPRKKITRKIKPPVEKVNPPLRRSKKKVNDATVVWSKEEDRLIMLCICARTIMSTVAQPGSLKVRNNVAQDLLSVNDPLKTRSVCHSRALHLEANAVLIHEKDAILNEVRRRPDIIIKYETIFKKIRLRFAGNMSKYVNESKLPMMELVWIMSRIDRINALKERIPCIATNIEDFFDKFTIKPSSNVSNTLETRENAALKECIILTVMLSFNTELKREVSKKIYYMLKEYPESTLRIVLDELRKGGAVVAKEKVMNGLMHRFNFEDMVKTSYKISANYQRRWLVRLNSEFADNVASLMDTEIPQSNCRVSAETNCLLCEMQACEVVEINSTTIPVIIDCSGTSVIQDEPLSVIDIETKYKLKSGTLGWKNKTDIQKFSQYKYDYPDFDDLLKTLARDAAVLYTKTEKTDMDNKIVSYLKIKGQDGSTFKELQVI
ncbi:hypothetical protein O3G_MSEX006972 [Manduca sexta]|uniref:B-block binding subunit of TFIIIC domain-containing protein n=1 Tax=Manduca sexta TaxID=7130 RepID=A0A921Z6P5_MANSE|nr:hypothetical protein O3G_MSEX006972 [Manduca sexta]